MITYKCFTRSEYKLLPQLEQVESVLRFASLRVDRLQELTDHRHHFGDIGLVWILRVGVFEDGFQEKRITSQTSSGLG